MIDFETARVKMVDNQIRTTDVTSHAVLTAFLDVPREAFVPAGKAALAYIDSDIALETSDGSRRYLLEPSPLAKLLQLAAISASDKVLEIGTGSGYVAALLSRLAASVVTVESDPGLASTAAANLKAQGAEAVKVVTGALEKGAASSGPYDVVFVSGAVEVIPDALLAQLADGGRLVTVVGHGNAARATVVTREGAAYSTATFFNTAVPSLPGFARAAEFAF